MTNLKKCHSCNVYTLKGECGKCGSRTKDAHYKFLGLGERIFGAKNK
jgi:recombinational DNA repair protein RecR